MSTQFNDTKTSYGFISKVAHWLTAILILGMIIAGFIMTNLPKEAAYKMPLIIAHKSIGIIIALLSPLVILWIILRHTSPAYPKNMNHWLVYLARIVKLSLLLIILIMPWSGYMMATAAGRKANFFQLFQVPTLFNFTAAGGSLAHTIHVFVAPIAAGLIAVHILAALKHHYIDRDNVLRRMLF